MVMTRCQPKLGHPIDLVIKEHGNPFSCLFCIVKTDIIGFDYFFQPPNLEFHMVLLVAKVLFLPLINVWRKPQATRWRRFHLVLVPSESLLRKTQSARGVLFCKTLDQTNEALQFWRQNGFEMVLLSRSLVLRQNCQVKCWRVWRVWQRLGFGMGKRWGETKWHEDDEDEQWQEEFLTGR